MKPHNKEVIQAHKKKKVLIIAFSFLEKDPRVYRQIRFIKDEYEVTALGFSDPCIQGVSYIPVPYHVPDLKRKIRYAVALKTLAYEKIYWSDPLCSP